MKMNYLKQGLIFIISILLFASCEEKLQTEFGNSYVYFSNVYPSLQFKGVDVVSLPQITAEQDSTYMNVGVYRSGIVDNLNEITLKLSIDSVYVDSLITKAQTATTAETTEIMKKFINSKALGASYFSIPASVTIPAGDRRATVPILIKRSPVKLYNNAYFNYDAADLANVAVPKDKMLILPIKITASSSVPLLKTQQRCYLQITKFGTLK
jgi:hypothetical protein